MIGEDGKQLGILLAQTEALHMAKDQELDLVEISPDANPPVAKIVDWVGWNYQRTKQLQKNKRNTKVQDLKQMRFGLKIGDHDLAPSRCGKLPASWKKGHKVKITLFYRGREMAHRELGFYFKLHNGL